MSVNPIKIFTGNSNIDLAKSISKYLDIPLGKCTVSKFANGETGVTISESGIYFYLELIFIKKFEIVMFLLFNLLQIQILILI